MWCSALLLLSLIVCLSPPVSALDVLTHEQLQDLWTNYKLKYNKHYDEIQDAYRLQIWRDNVNNILLHNLQNDLGQHSFRLGVNKFTDWTLGEYQKILLGFRANRRNTALIGLNDTTNDIHYYKFDTAGLPDTVDWRKEGAVTPVKDQQQCGSCWAFSTTGSLEGLWFRKTGNLVSLSEQQLVDCSGDFGNQGCDGGWMNVSFEYVAKNGGIDTEDSYPYEGVDGQCRYKPTAVGATCTGSIDVSPVGDESALMSAVANVGPISVAIDAGHSSFQSYTSGVYDEPACTNNVDHGVLVVGYGTEDGLDYWLVKNSWGEDWGDNGYIKMSRNKNNQCGIASYAVYPTL